MREPYTIRGQSLASYPPRAGDVGSALLRYLTSQNNCCRGPECSTTKHSHINSISRLCSQLKPDFDVLPSATTSRLSYLIAIFMPRTKSASSAPKSFAWLEDAFHTGHEAQDGLIQAAISEQKSEIGLSFVPSHPHTLLQTRR
jgi:cellobiose-specific phosphotransferase system component IIA